MVRSLRILNFMCGRFVHAVPFAVLAGWLEGTFDPAVVEQYQPSWNVSPTSTVVAMRVENDERVLSLYRWGLVVPWAKELPRFPSHNARRDRRVQAHLPSGLR
jgi:putative SOS response-associated peptidase YedK